MAEYKAIQYGKRSCSSDFDRRPVDRNGKGTVSMMKGKTAAGGSNGCCATQTKKHKSTGRGQ